MRKARPREKPVAVHVEGMTEAAFTKPKFVLFYMISNMCCQINESGAGWLFPV